MRNLLHKIISYKKRVGRYVVKVEYIDGNWWTFVLVDAVEKHHNAQVVYSHQQDSKGYFGWARWKGLSYIDSQTA